MKKMMTIFALLLSFGAIANEEIYKNNSGCEVIKETRANGTILYVTKNGKQEIVGFGKDYSFGTFAYCSDSALEINFLEGKAGTGIMLSCSEHENGHAITRGRVDIEILKGALSSVVIDGQVKGTFGWKQDTKMECKNLRKQ